LLEGFSSLAHWVVAAIFVPSISFVNAAQAQQTQMPDFNIGSYCGGMGAAFYSKHQFAVGAAVEHRCVWKEEEARTELSKTWKDLPDEIRKTCTAHRFLTITNYVSIRDLVNEQRK
jgi:hypothetical protein